PLIDSSTAVSSATTLSDAQRQGLEQVVRASTNQIWFEQNVGQFPQSALYGSRTTFGAMLVYDDHLQLISTQTDTATGTYQGQQVVDVRFTGSNAHWDIVPGSASDVSGGYQ